MTRAATNSNPIMPFPSSRKYKRCNPPKFPFHFRRYSGMPIPPIPLAIGALLGGTAVKKGKDQFQAVKGRKHKDGTTGKAFIRKKAKRKQAKAS